MFDVLEKGDSIRNPITNKYDIILANPPFGIDGLTYDDINHALRNEYLPIKSNSAVPLFLQAIIYQLKINGRCAIVLPEGQELFSKNSALVAVREFLMKTCDLKEVIYLPAGTFTHTTIKTCVFYFIKKREGKDALETNIKVSKITQKETCREYKFSKTHQTTKVHFYDYNPDNDIKHELIEGGVSIDELSKNNYSLNYAEYLKDNVEDEVYEEGIVIKKLGDICDIDKNITKHSTEYGKSNGKYKFHTGGVRTDLYVDEYDIEDMYIIQNRTNGSGKCNLFLDKKFSLAKQTMVYRAKNKNEITTKYIYYYLSANIDILEKGFIGANHKNISHEYLENIKIPIPSIEKQKEIVSYLDFIYEKCNKTSNDKIEELKKLNEFYLNNQRVFGENEMKTLGEVCKVNQGTYIKTDMKIKGEYPVYGGGNISFYINQWNRENEIIVAKDGVSENCVRYEKDKFFLNHHGWTINCKEIIIKKYMYYYLHTIQSQLLNIAKGTAQLGINQDNFYKLKIPVPSLEKQKEIIEYCESNNNLIKQLENEIEQNKIQANLFLSSIVKKVKIEQDELSNNESNSTKS
jgi:restriction endonuclease S subunit